MDTVQPRRILVVSLLLTALLGLAVGLGLSKPLAPHEEMVALLPAITLPTIVVAGLTDGINPCAFTVLLLFITALLAIMQRSGAVNMNIVRARIIGFGSIYIAAIFLTYLALGVGVLATADIFVKNHLSARVGALLAILMGLWMMKDYFLPDIGPRLQAPVWLGAQLSAVTRRATVPAMIAAGFLVGLCTVPCSGAIYLAILSLLTMQSSAFISYGYLLLYNLMFILPLAAILVVASARPSLNRLAHWNLHHKEWVRLALGGGVVLMGLVILATV
jgi:cytochrome c biogenesis protein CcdA